MEFVKCEQQSSVALVTIDRQCALNALNRQVLTELFEIADQENAMSTFVEKREAAPFING